MEETYQIKLDGKVLISGDPKSIIVIFNNLNGANFTPERRAPGSIGTHEDYLACMAQEWCVAAWNGTLMLHSENGAALAKHDFQTSVPDMCFIFCPEAKPGEYVKAVRRGELGYYGTTYDETNPRNAEALVTHMNRKLGVSESQAERMRAGSMFGWNSPSAKPESLTEKAETLGFLSLDEMHKHQAWLAQQKDQHGATMRYQQTSKAQSRIAAASEAHGIPADSIVHVIPEGEDEEENGFSFRP